MDLDPRLSDRIAEWAEAALRTHALDLDLTYEPIVTFLATPQGPQLVCQLVMMIPSPLLGKHIVQIDQFGALGITRDGIVEKVVEQVGKLRAEFTRQLSASLS